MEERGNSGARQLAVDKIFDAGGIESSVKNEGGRYHAMHLGIKAGLYPTICFPHPEGEGELDFGNNRQIGIRPSNQPVVFNSHS